MSVESEVKLPHSAPVQSVGWRVWDKAVDGLALLILTVFLPVAALGRAIRRAGQRSRLAELRHNYEIHRYHMTLAAEYPLDFLAMHLDRLCEMEARYLTTPWVNLAQAEVGYKLLEAARAALIAEAQAEIQRKRS